MIWYRHWLEVRRWLLGAAIGALLLGLLYPLALDGVTDYFSHTGKLTEELRGLEDRLPKMGADTLLPWGVHAWFGTWIAILLPLLFASSGVITNTGWGGHPSIYYTLALPVPRSRLVFTRFLTGVAGVAAILSFSLAANCSGLLLLGRTVPLGAMAFSSFRAMLAVLPVLSLIGLFHLMANQISFVPGPVIWLCTLRWQWAAVTRFVYSPSVPWTTVGLLLALTGLFVGLTMWLAGEKEF